jgi:2'-5' RNA ligase
MTRYCRPVPRFRLAVALLVPDPLSGEVDGLRRAFGDPSRDRIAPHITLVPPVNVRDFDLHAALSVVRGAAGRARPIDLRLGPLRTFPGPGHVGYLSVGAEPPALEVLRRLRADVLQPPLERRIDREFVPHVTVTRGLDADRLAAVLEASADFRDVETRIGSVHLLQERHDGDRRRWRPIADVALGAPVIVGRGGLPVELTPGDLVDPEALDTSGASPAEVPPGARPLVVAARSEGAVVGVARGWTAGPVSELADVWVAEADSGIERHLRAAWLSAAAVRGSAPPVRSDH